MGNCCYENYNNSSDLPGNRIYNTVGRGSLFQRLTGNFANATARKEKFIVFGQDKNGYNFFLRLDPIKMTLRTEGLPSYANFYNYSAVTMKDSDTIIVCGGIKHNLTGITNQCFAYSFSQHSCTKMSNMIDIRYTFSTIFHREKLYAIGGRIYGDDTVSLLKKCEVFDFSNNKWSQIPDMNVPRCTSSVFIYNNELWVMGGYTGRYQRSKKIERFLEEENRWEIIDFKLFFGFENGNVIITGRPNEILLLGGKMNFGSSNNVWMYDLHNKTVINRKPLTNDCILTKYQMIEENVVCILGEIQGKGTFYEKYDIITSQHSSGSFSLSRKNLEKFKQYNFNTPPLVVPYDPEATISYEDRDYSLKNVIFGTDQEPFQLEVDSLTGDIRLEPIPTKLKLRNFQGCCRISANEVLMCGGINITFQRISSRAFIYNLKNREISFIPDMRKMRYTFALTFHKGFLYVMGGREYGDDKNAIYVDCERYNFEAQDWQYIGSLNIARCTSNTFIVADRLYIAGGYCRNSKRTDTIEVYSEAKNRWELLGMALPSPIEASCFITNHTEVFYCAGRTDSGDCKSKYKFKLERGDLETVAKIPDEIAYPLCLQKVVYVKDAFFIFGSVEFNKINAIIANDFSNLKTVSSGTRPSPHRTGQEISELNYDDFKGILESVLRSVAFSTHYIKRNSYVLPSKFC